MSFNHIAFIGSGNVAWHLAPILDRMYYAVKEVYSPQHDHAVLLSQRLYQAEVRTSLDFSVSSARIFIIAVADDAIRSVMQNIVLPEGSIVLHTSGSQPLDVLENPVTPHIGVFYPLQTFSRDRPIELKGVPILFEGKTKEAEQMIVALSKAIDGNPKKMNSRERRVVHIAAIFASNFLNHMLTISHDLLRKEGLNPELLKSLVSETVAKGLTIGPEKVQTGPAIRRDVGVIDAHIRFLNRDEIVAMLYQQISQHIMGRYAIDKNSDYWS